MYICLYVCVHVCMDVCIINPPRERERDGEFKLFIKPGTKPEKQEFSDPYTLKAPTP